MLIEDFYKFKNIETQPDLIKADVELNRLSNVFKGHFPDNPVMPGVMQVQLVRDLLEHTMTKKLELVSMGRCKFLAVVNPNKTNVLHVKIKILNRDEGLKISAEGFYNETTCFKFSAVYNEC